MHNTGLCSKKTTSLLLFRLSQATRNHTQKTLWLEFFMHRMCPLCTTLYSAPPLSHWPPSSIFCFSGFGTSIVWSWGFQSHCLISWLTADLLFPDSAQETCFPLCFSLECRSYTKKNPGKFLAKTTAPLRCAFFFFLLSLFHRTFEVIWIKNIKLCDDT